ncbi:MAG: DUF6056 family protein, partial [Acutalibacteraceae bacterium]
YTVFPVAALVAIPSIDMLRECYYLFASFCNYVIPIVFILIAYLIQKTIKENKAVNKILKAVLYAAMLLLFAGGCLFSENTTIVIFCAVILAAINGYIENKKVTFADVTAVIGAALGSFAMLLIPKITATEYKMDGYRSVATDLKNILSLASGGLTEFSSIFSRWIFVIFVLTAALVFVIKKQTKGKKSVRSFQLGMIICYPFACAAIYALDSNVKIMRSDIVCFALTALYALTAFYTLMMIEDKKLRRISFMACILIASSVAPLMIVDTRGARTYYTTFVIILIFALWLIKQFAPPVIRQKITEQKRVISLAGAAAAAVLSVTLFIQSVYNFDLYAMRSDYIAQNIDSQQLLEIPVLPFDGISVEWGADFSYKIWVVDTDEENNKCKYINIKSSDMFDEYYDKVIDVPFFKAVSFAAENYEFKNPLYPQQLREKYNAER